MKLWVTPQGDRWLCEECREELTEKINSEQWRMALDKNDPMLRCSNCNHGDIEIDD